MHFIAVSLYRSNLRKCGRNLPNLPIVNANGFIRHRETKLLVAHPEPLKRNFGDDVRRSTELFFCSNRSGERSLAVFLVVHLVIENPAKHAGNRFLEARVFQGSANLVECAAASFRQSDGGAFERFVGALDIFRPDRSGTVKQSREALRVAGSYRSK